MPTIRVYGSKFQAVPLIIFGWGFSGRSFDAHRTPTMKLGSPGINAYSLTFVLLELENPRRKHTRHINLREAVHIKAQSNEILPSSLFSNFLLACGSN